MQRTLTTRVRSQTGGSVTLGTRFGHAAQALLIPLDVALAGDTGRPGEVYLFIGVNK